MKIIHCGDIHLDARMEANLSPELARQRRNELLHTFERMVAYAAENGVRLILIAGDLFDAKTVSARAANAVKNAIMLHPEIDFLYLKGNHDCVSFMNRFEYIPDNLKLFDESWRTYDYEERVSISGAELGEGNRTTLYGTLALEQSRINIVLLHGQLTKSGTPQNAKEERIYINELKGKYIDYLALGHIHSYRQERLDGRGIYAYCGCLEGRGFDEIGEKGFVLLETDETSGAVRSTFIPFAERTLHLVTADLTGISESHEIDERIEAALREAGIPGKDMVRLVLTGEIEGGDAALRLEPNAAYLEQKFGGGYLFFKVIGNWRYAIHPEDYANDVSLKGEFVRTVLSAGKMTQEDKDAVILYGIRALAGEDLL